MKTRVPMKAEPHGNRLPQTIETLVVDDRQYGPHREREMARW